MHNNIAIPSSVLASKPASKVSSKYSFFRTTDIIEAMQDKGFLISAANQRGKSEFGRHLVRMRHESLLDRKDLVPEIVISNSHNGSSPLELMSGMYRLICSNGLVVGTTDASIKILHRSNKTFADVLEAADKIHQISIASLDAAEAWSKIKMDVEAQEAFTKLVGQTFKGNEGYFNRSDLLEARYDEEMNLWTTYNLAQESLTKGTRTAAGRQTRGINGVRGNTVMNKTLWQLAEQFA